MTQMPPFTLLSPRIDEDAVVRSREAVSTPIDRIWALGAIELGSTGS